METKRWPLHSVPTVAQNPVVLWALVQKTLFLGKQSFRVYLDSDKEACEQLGRDLVATKPEEVESIECDVVPAENVRAVTVAQ